MKAAVQRGREAAIQRRRMLSTFFQEQGDGLLAGEQPGMCDHFVIGREINFINKGSVRTIV